MFGTLPAFLFFPHQPLWVTVSKTHDKKAHEELFKCLARTVCSVVLVHVCFIARGCRPAKSYRCRIVDTLERQVHK